MYALKYKKEEPTVIVQGDRRLGAHSLILSVLFADFGQDALQAVQAPQESTVRTVVHLGICAAHGRSVLDLEGGVCEVDHSHIGQSERARSTGAVSAGRRGLRLGAELSPETLLHFGCCCSAAGGGFFSSVALRADGRLLEQMSLVVLVVVIVHGALFVVVEIVHFFILVVTGVGLIVRLTATTTTIVIGIVNIVNTATTMRARRRRRRGGCRHRRSYCNRREN